VLSGACCYTILYCFVLIFLPLIIVYNSHDFWWKQGYYLEQPALSYKYLANFQWYGLNNQTGQVFTLMYSTNPTINQLYSTFRIPTIRSAELDDNRDGIIERLEMSINLPLQDYELIYGFTAMVYYNCKLYSRAKYTFDSIAYMNYESGTPMKELQIDGEMMFHQSSPLSVFGGYTILYADDPLVDVTNTISAEDVSIETIMSKFNARDTSFRFRPSYQYVSKRGVFPFAQYNPQDHISAFNTSITIRIPSQIINFTPEISAVLKFAWIQYMSIFVVVAFLLFSLNSFIFKHQLLFTHSIADIHHEKIQ